MTHDEAFLQAIREAPDDDGPRLVYADWLDEHGQADRAEFIRVQCERARAGEESPRAAALLQRARALLQVHWEEWVGPLREATRPTGAQFGEAWLAGGFQATGLAKFRRGFVDTLTLGTEEFLGRADVLARLVPLRHLSLRGAGRRAEALAGASFLDSVETLSFVDYFDSPLTAGGARALAGSPHLGRLTTLYLYSNDVADAGLKALAAAPWLRGLQSLNLTGNGLTAAGVRALAESPLPQRLGVLWLGHNRLGNDSLSALANSPLWAGLRILNLNAAHIGPEGIAALTSAPSGALQRLNLNFNSLGPDGAERLAGAACLSSLTALDLGTCGLGDEGAAALARSPHLSGLQTLNLENNGITGRGARALADSPHFRLQHLSLVGNPAAS